METVDGFVENEGKIVESEAAQDGFTVSPNQIADPVVYKLVRVKDTVVLIEMSIDEDDEVMEVEDLLEDDKNEKVEDAGQSVGCIPKEGTLFGKPHVEILNDIPGLQQYETFEAAAEYNARLEYIEEVLQKVKQEEKLRLTCGSPKYASACVKEDRKGSDEHGRLPVIEEKLQSNFSLPEITHSVSPSVNKNHVNECGSLGDKSLDSESSDTLRATSNPDFSLLKGDVYLDNLSIRELRECFKATFGRDTTVKDKSWLKRRIAMGLTNSCDIPASSLIIKEGKIVEESSQNVEGMPTIPTAEASNIECKGSPTTYSLENKDLHHFEHMELEHGSESHHDERTAIKRVRKPTKRYIEELSEVEPKEYIQKVISLNKNTISDDVSASSIARPIKKICSDGGRTVITRLDSLGGSGFQVPCVSRVRRSRPRKDVVALVFSLPNKDQKPSVMVTDEAEKNLEQKQTTSGNAEKNLEQKQTTSGNSSDDNTAAVVAVATSKGGMRRKHHRAWTLVEVIKLVEGVSICGAGRWSEIKKLSFSSYSYRTSVDLKDKWRNLLKASFAQTPVDEGISSRKQASISIPAQILLRVRELAEMQAQIPPSNHGQGKLGGGVGESVHEMSSSAICS